jgi:hypothetical protein
MSAGSSIPTASDGGSRIVWMIIGRSSATSCRNTSSSASLVAERRAAAPAIPAAGRGSDRAVVAPSTDHRRHRLPRRTRSSVPTVDLLAPTGWQPVADPAWTDTPIGMPSTATPSTRAASTNRSRATTASNPNQHRVGTGRCLTRHQARRGKGSLRLPVPNRALVGGLWHYAAAALKQYKLAMVTTRSGRDNRTIALRQQGDRRTVSAAGPHWITSRSDPA